MDLKKPPFNRDDCSSFTQYREELMEFYRKEYVGKTIQFNCELITLGGNTVQPKGKQVRVCDIELGWLKVIEMDGTPIDGLYSPQSFDLQH